MGFRWGALTLMRGLCGLQAGDELRLGKGHGVAFHRRGCGGSLGDFCVLVGVHTHLFERGQAVGFGEVWEFAKGGGDEGLDFGDFGIVGEHFGVGFEHGGEECAADGAVGGGGEASDDAGEAVDGAEAGIGKGDAGGEGDMGEGVAGVLVFVLH